MTALLVSAMRYEAGPTPPIELPDVTVDRVAEVANCHRVAPAAWRYLHAAGVQPESLTRLRRLYDDQLARHLTVAADLAWAAGILDRTGADWSVLKGPVLSDLIWPRPDMRQYYDLDILVDRHAYGETIESLVAGGAQLLDRNWPLIWRQRRAQLTLVLPYGTSLDLHWHLLNHSDLRQAMPFDVGGLLDRVRPVTIGNLAVPTFDPVDTLLTVALHAAHAGANRLVWMRDAERASAAPGLDWSEVAGRADSMGLALALSVVLVRAWRLFGGRPETPGWTPRRGTVAAVSSMLDRAIPMARGSQKGRTGQLLYRSIRRSDSETLRAAYATLRRPPAGWPYAPGNPLHIDIADESSRTGYFEWVETAPSP